MQDSILAAVMLFLFQKFDFKFADREYKMIVRQTLTLKPRDLFVYAKLRPGLDVLTMQRDIQHGPSGSNPIAPSRGHGLDNIREISISLNPLSIF